jgi:predicted nuclease of predicted toxin-antitoxin system
MKILFDQGTPVPLRRFLPGHVVDTAAENGWSTVQNGDLLQLAESNGYEVLITTDQNLRYQQNMTDRRIGIVVLMKTSWPKIQQKVPEISSAIVPSRRRSVC